MEGSARILYCQCKFSDVISEDVKREIEAALRDSGVEFEPVADLCGMVARRDPLLERIVGSGNVKIAACFPRVVKWLFHSAGVELDDERVAVVAMRGESAERVINQLLPDESKIERKAGSERVVVGESVDWVPWFPVIDYDRCTNCKQCLSFCLFDVFGVDEEDRIEVKNPDQCKTNCPACSRVCPNVAIMFPKFDKRPINGDEVTEEDLQHETVRVNVSELLGQDVHSLLKGRSSKGEQRFSADRKQEQQAAELADMQAQLEIPDEVMKDLGCGCACQRKAAEPEKPKVEQPQTRSCGCGGEAKTPESEWGI